MGFQSENGSFGSEFENSKSGYRYSSHLATFPGEHKLTAVRMKIALLVVLFIVHYSVDANVVKSIPDELNKLLRFLQPQMRKLARDYVPRTYGNCHEDNPPRKCQNVGNLYDHKTSLYHVKARWITGINDVHLRELRITVPKKNRLNLRMMIELVTAEMVLIY